MDTIIAALILAVVGALYKIFAQQKAITRLESKLDNLQKQLADVMATVYLLSSEAKSSPTQQSASDIRQNQPVTEPINDPITQPIGQAPVSAPLLVPLPAPLPIVASLPMANTLDASTSSAPPTATQPSVNDAAPPHQPSVSQPSSPSLKEDESATNVVTSLWASATQWFFGENLVVRVGALVLLVGVVLLLKLASQYIEVSMPVRMALVALGGLVITTIGYRTTAKKRSYGLTLQGVGFAVIYLTVFASFKLYGLLPSTLTFGVLALLAGLTVMFSVWQNALPLAVLAFGGAFFAPILVSRPDGSVVMLFSYYLLLNIAVAVIAHYRTWKLLNALSLAVTFGLAYVWGFRAFSGNSAGAGWLSLRWQLLGLLVGHMALYLFIAVRYSQQVVSYNQTLLQMNRGVAKRPILSIDSGLLFGTALLGFGLMASLLNDLPYHLAFASSALSAIYLSLGLWLLKHHRRSIAGDRQANNQFDNSFELLIEASLALGCGFLALVIPLALSAKWISIGWAVQGAALVWLGARTQRRWTVYFGLALQGFSILLLVGFDTIMRHWYGLLDQLSVPHQMSIVAASSTLPLTVLTACVLLSAFILRHGRANIAAATPQAKAQPQPQPAAVKTTHKRFQQIADNASHSFVATALVVVGFVLYLSAILSADPFWNNGGKTTTIKLAVAMAVFLIVGQLMHQRFVWRSMRKVSRLILPFAMMSWVLVCLTHVKVETVVDLNDYHIKAFSGLGRYLLAMLGCLAIAKLLGAWLLSRWHRDRLDTSVDALVWFLVLIAMLTWMLQQVPFNYWQQAQELRAIVTILPTVLAVFGLMSLLLLPKLQALRARLLGWLEVDTLLKHSAYILVPMTFIWSLSANFSLDGQLLGVYLPLLNPLDLTLISILLYQSYVALKVDSNYRTIVLVACGLGAFVTVSSMLVRGFASVWGTPTWEHGAWSVSMVQTGLTILWTVIAMVLMFLANKKAIRLVWFAGIALLTIVVAKLVLIDMSNTSAVLRVVSFIGAGLLMLVIGYLAPLPPKVGKPKLDKPNAAKKS
ncbi:hypothetical protein A9Z64_02005 [Moraxella osloensis]|uniref:Predicted membrane protein n=1 Tax=Faucicola osloensis TaxID=34062 RepID=A0A378Q791_FAUOS|nr:DUF2339 domain-containing protein [Moraxella osloensis]AME01326.1 hypothetical protein AXE82_05780 [Moraxella osloensis]OBX52077.1 hypothetical protein A9Z64_02005 [Moraxella osloensis]QPT42940.1 DUF2339 domain-containing protein [Moraxella osloensis]STY96542.1 Predicted membrane protein [Moraxella osloensis]